MYSYTLEFLRDADNADPMMALPYAIGFVAACVGYVLIFAIIDEWPGWAYFTGLVWWEWFVIAVLTISCGAIFGIPAFLFTCIFAILLYAIVLDILRLIYWIYKKTIRRLL